MSIYIAINDTELLELMRGREVVFSQFKKPIILQHVIRHEVPHEVRKKLHKGDRLNIKVSIEPEESQVSRVGYAKGVYINHGDITSTVMGDFVARLYQVERQRVEQIFLSAAMMMAEDLEQLYNELVEAGDPHFKP
jgi:hypothetical protein